MSSRKPVGYFVINTRLGNYQGHSINISKTIEGMRAAGFDMRIVAPRYDRNVDLAHVFADYTLETVIPVVQLWTPFRRPGRWAFIYYTGAVWLWLAWQICRRRCQCIYVRSEYLFPLGWLAILTRTPLFYEIHRVGLTGRVQRVKERLARMASGLVVLTDVLQKEFSGCHSHIHVEHDAVNYEHFAVTDDKASHRQALGWPQDTPIMVYTGSVQPIKGIDMIVENANAFPQVQFYIIGRIKESLQTYLREVPNNVHVLGDYTHDQLPAYLMAADVLLLPQPTGPQSQSPMKLFEYLATGRPILSSDLENIKEVLPEGNLLYAVDDHAAFQAAIQAYLDSPATYDTLSDRNQAAAREHTYIKRGARIAEFVQAGLSGFTNSK